MTGVREHAPLRPLWLCRVDGGPWPCGRCKLALIRQAGEDRVAVCVYLASCLHDLIADLYRLMPDTAPEPRELAERVFGWLPPRRPAGRTLPDDGAS